MYLALLHLVVIISDLAALAAEADRMVVESVAETTRWTYEKVIIKLGDFCLLHHIKDKFSASTVELFVIKLKNDGLGIRAIKSSLSAIRHYCKSHKVSIAFDTPWLQMMLRGVQRTNPPSRRANLAVSVSNLRKLCANAPLCFGDYIGSMLCALFTSAFFGLLRPCEAAGSKATPHHQLKVCQVRVRGNYLSISFVSFKHAKQPVKIRVPAHHESVICPVKCMRRYLDIGPAPSAPSLPLFPSSTGEINSVLRQCLHKCSLCDMLTLHSFRRGGATFYSSAGMSDASLCAKGRWNSKAYLSYVKPR